MRRHRTPQNARKTGAGCTHVPGFWEAPDLNPLENLWGILKQEMGSTKILTDKVETVVT